MGGVNLMECSSVGMKPRGGGLGVWEGAGLPLNAPSIWYSLRGV